MKILLTNDDGIQAKGINALIDALKEDNEVYVVAPNEQRSGFSHSASYFCKDIECIEYQIDGCIKAYGTSGSPADCVYVALNGLLDDDIDLVISGVNHGMNMASDCIYSGTVGSASEGYILGKPSIAVSLCSYTSDDYNASARVIKDLIPLLMNQENKNSYTLNVNIPPIAYEDIKGYKVTELAGVRGYRRKMKKMNQGDVVVMHSDNGKIYDDLLLNENGDIKAVHDGYVSLTPLYIDLTYNEMLESVRSMIESK